MNGTATMTEGEVIWVRPETLMGIPVDWTHAGDNRPPVAEKVTPYGSNRKARRRWAAEQRRGNRR